MEQVASVEAELKQLKEDHEALKTSAAEAAELKKQWSAHLKTVKGEQPTGDAATDEATADYNSKLQDAQVNEAAAKSAVDEAKAAVKASTERQKELRKWLADNKAAAKKEADAAEAEAKKAEAAAWREANTQNGMTRPREGTVGSRLWEIFDSLSAQKGSAVSLEEAREVAEPEGIAGGSISSGYAHWRKFHGLTGRILSQRAIDEAAAKEQAKAEKAAEREAKRAEREAEKARKAQEKAEATAAKAAAAE